MLNMDDCRRGLRIGQNEGKGCRIWTLGWLFGWGRVVERGWGDDFLRSRFVWKRRSKVAERGVEGAFCRVRSGFLEGKMDGY